jgi:hypothetical protein
MASKLKRRHGRPRKLGPRQRNGHLKRARRELEPDSPRAIAARMPHRRALGEHALDQQAESELGRLVLRGQIEPHHALAGECYAKLWLGYIATLEAPRRPWRGQGRDLACNGCPTPEERKFCVCDFKKRIWFEAYKCLVATGGSAFLLVRFVAVLDLPCPDELLPELIKGLTALAYKFGLTSRRNSATKVMVTNHAD